MRSDRSFEIELQLMHQLQIKREEELEKWRQEMLQ